MLKRRFRHSLVAALVVLSMLGQVTWVLAGTTGTLGGTATDSSTKAPVAGAKVTAASPSQVAATTTDASGHYVFLNLAPDTYVVSLDASGFEPLAVPGVTIQADNARVLDLSAQKHLTTIGRVTSRAVTSLVKPGTTSDVYSVTAEQQQKFQGIGGGAELNNAYSAIATIPGAFVPQGAQDGNGFPEVNIRGGDYNQIGFEIDGVPVNRSFDNYPSGPASSLGQQELQVYTGANPANSEGQGLAGFINQVIRTGTYPGYAEVDTGIGAPTFYHKISFEVGGATPSRNFTYFLAAGGYDQDFRYADNYNGAQYDSSYGTALIPTCGLSTVNISNSPSCFNANGKPYGGVYEQTPDFGTVSAFNLGAYNAFSLAHIMDRDTVANIHVGIPRKDGLKDDIQLLGMINLVGSTYYDSTNDQGGASYLNAIGVGTPIYIDGYQYNGQLGAPLPSNYQALTTQYLFPQSNPGRQMFAAIPDTARDSIMNNQNILKLQYAHPFSTTALLKVYGYTYYSNWTQLGPQSTWSDVFGATSPDYELSSHTRGLSGTFSDQLNPKNLLQVQGSYTTATTVRDNNTQMINGLYTLFGIPGLETTRTVVGVMVNSHNPFAGLCYAIPSSGNSAIPTTCAIGGGAAMTTIGDMATGAIQQIPSGLTCGGGPCQYYAMQNGLYATYNTVVPRFSAFSATDQWKPSEKVSVDYGLRFDQFQFVGSDTGDGPARQFWYQAFNLDNCVGTAPSNLGNLIARNPGQACAAGSSAANFTNPSGNVTQTYDEVQPRVAGTYQIDPRTVLRASYGRYSQAPNSAFEQYNALQADAPDLLYGVYNFQKFGFTTPNHAVQPETSNNFDLSYEHQFAGDLSVKLTPFLRTTQNQIQQFYLNQQTSFVSGLNVGQQTSQGLEFELDKGSFAQNGVAGKLSFTYTNSFIKYTPLSNGSTIITPFNQAIQQYNGYTSFCASHPTDSRCGKTATGAVAAPCYTTTGAPQGVSGAAPCSSADVANPYWNAPVQGLFDVNGNYPTFDIFPAGIGTSVNTYGAPYFATLVLQYKHDKLAVTPAFQFFAGQRYGAPLTTYGVAPDQCAAVFGGSPNGPRYPYGAAGGTPFDASACSDLAGGIPDPYTKQFDSLGAFIAPSQFQMHLQLSYQVSAKTTLIANFTNIVNSCFGGTKTGFTLSSACGYGVVGGGTAGDVGNAYNPGAHIQPYLNTPYEPTFQLYPFNFFVSAQFKV